MMSFTLRLSVCLTGTIAAGLTSCVLNTAPVPEMPYRPRPVSPQQTQKQEESVQSTTWENTPEASSFITPPAPSPTAQTASSSATSAPAPVSNPAAALNSIPTLSSDPAPIPDPAVESNKSAETPPTVINLSTPPEESSSPTPAAPETTPTPATDLKQITNTGPIPTAARVEGDPTRVWNPLDPSKKIRIINPKTNQPYPSGKKLKVRGTNFQFYVP